jgi:ketosteroid isomerase-like protein
VPAAHAPAADNGAQWEIMAVYSRFIAAQNAHDRAALAAVLLDSQDFVWTAHGGDAVWGYREAMEAFERQWQGTWKLEPQLKGLRIASVAADTAVLVTPLLLTQGKPGAAAATVTVSWGGVFVRTQTGWRLASIFVTPLPGRHAPGGG